VTYFFNGFFVDSHDSRIIDSVKRLWSNVVVKKIDRNYDKPFVCLGVASPFSDHNWYDNKDVAFSDESKAVTDAIRNGLPSLSRSFPEATFVFVSVDCHGGDCSYVGYACRNGSILFRTGEGSWNRGAQNENLRALLRFLGIELDEGAYFEPFERSYFKSV
jgi:hypothetical protein